MTHSHTAPSATRAAYRSTDAGLFPQLRLALYSPLALLMHWQARHEQRLALATLDDRLLADVGLTRRQARVEAQRMF